MIDAKPNAVAGYPVHFIYAVPSDGTDRLSTFANRMETDWEAIDSWWRGQDPTRTPRADVAQFPCGLQIDLSSVKLRQSSAQIAAQEEPFDQVFDSLDSWASPRSSRSTSSTTTGRWGTTNICGIGGSLRGGFGLAVISVRACAGVDTAQIAAHELTHTLGAVPSGAPHDCPAPNDGHTCDNDRDLMYPTTDGTPLSGLTLDPGRDDYYGHSGPWLDVQDSPWLVQLDRQSPFSLAVSGSGQVEADVPGLLCSRSCSTSWNTGTQLSLSATPVQRCQVHPVGRRLRGIVPVPRDRRSDRTCQRVVRTAHLPAHGASDGQGQRSRRERRNRVPRASAGRRSAPTGS